MSSHGLPQGFRSAAAEVNVPTLVIVGEKDAITSPAVMKQMADRIPNSYFVQISEAAHLTPMERPEAFNTALMEFLKNLV